MYKPGSFIEFWHPRKGDEGAQRKTGIINGEPWTGPDGMTYIPVHHSLTNDNLMVPESNLVENNEVDPRVSPFTGPQG